MQEPAQHDSDLGYDPRSSYPQRHLLNLLHSRSAQTSGCSQQHLTSSTMSLKGEGVWAGEDMNSGPQSLNFNKARWARWPCVQEIYQKASSGQNESTQFRTQDVTSSGYVTWQLGTEHPKTHARYLTPHWKS